MNPNTSELSGRLKTYTSLIRKAFKYIYQVDPHRYFYVKAALMDMVHTESLRPNCTDFSSAFIWADTEEGVTYWLAISYMCDESHNLDFGSDTDEKEQQEII